MKLLSEFLLLSLVSPLAAASPSSPLSIVHAVFAASEDGPPEAADEYFVPGETLYFSCQAEGFRKIDKRDDYPKQNVSLKFQIEVRDKNGVLLKPIQDGKIETTVTTEDKQWRPKLRETIVVPPLADTGEYAVLVKLSDDLAAATVEKRAEFHVKGRDVAPSDTLIVRNFRFLRNEDDDKPLEIAAYRPGDSVWARFDMTGYKLGDKNQVDIEYGLSVLREDGSVAYAEPQAANQKIQTYYPQRYQPGELNLNLGKDQPPGKYTIVLSVRDNLGRQLYETRETFSVE
ncbi:MAG: hypothetical protein JOZ32_02760 [Bryobacterales bacterium]|nr:hypothetical protein [Bryobacterales bacterium]